MANIFKSLTPTEYTIVPFPAYYKYSYTYTSGSTNNSEDVRILYGEKFLDSSGVIRTVNNTYELFDSVMQTFYSPIPYATYGIISASSYIPSHSVFVVSITQDLFGEKVAPGSFTIKVGTSESYDDGSGNVIVSSSGTGSIIGRIFYDKGIALLKPTSNIVSGGLVRDGICIVSGTSVTVNFSSSVTFYENAFKVKLKPTEFLYALNNPTIQSSVSGSGTTALQLMNSGSLLPYVTTIGFYNRKNELVLVAKPSVPVKRTSDVTQTFIVRFDI
jgi:hypothetical protein